MFIENIELNEDKFDIDDDDMHDEILSSKNSSSSNYFDGESDNDSKPSLENVEMLVDKNNFIYYMTKT